MLALAATLSLLQGIAVFAAGIVAGTINTVVGSGTLFTFPVLLGIGYAPVVANVSNTVGLVPGSVSGAIGYRRELAGQGSRVARLAAASLSGGIVGAVLLLVLPAGAFKAIVPAFIVIALVMILAQPRLAVLRGMGRGRPGARRIHAGPAGHPRRIRGRDLRRLLRGRAGHPRAGHPRPLDRR